MLSVKITYGPIMVRVADDRHEVAGADITICDPRYPEEHHYEIIPPEGHTADCWLGDAICEEDDLREGLARVARNAAEGQSGSLSVEVEEEE